MCHIGHIAQQNNYYRLLTSWGVKKEIKSDCRHGDIIITEIAFYSLKIEKKS